MKAFNRNSILMIIGQIISLFGSAILRFFLSLYILQVTGSTSVFATTLAVSISPTILLPPLGGILADRVSRRSIMLSLDFLTSFLILGSFMVSTRGFGTALVAIPMISLSIIQAFYQPSVQASIPLLVSENQLTQVNGIVVQINALATPLGPILGGFLFSFLPFFLLLNILGTAFFLSVVLGCIMRIPFQCVAADEPVPSTMRSDCHQSLHSLWHDNPTFPHLLLLLTGLNLALSSFITVGLPVISNIALQFPPTFYGWLEAATGIGSIAGSIALSFFLKWMDISGAWRFLLSGSLPLLPMASVLSLYTPAYIAYACIFVSSICIMLLAVLFNIYAQTFLQKFTPSQLLEKVASMVTMVVMCSYSIGQSLYSILLETSAIRAGLLILFVYIASLTASLPSRNTLKMTGNDCEKGAVLI